MGKPEMRLKTAVLIAAGLCAAASAADRYAVVIGVDNYEALGKLTTCVADARAVQDVLIERCGFEPTFVALLTDDAEEKVNQPTLNRMRGRLTQIAELAQEGDTILFFFSGHGITEEGKGYLVPIDGDGRAESSLPLDEVRAVLGRSKAAAKLLVLDACHAGSAAKGVGGITPSLIQEAPGLVMLLSSDARQQSYPDTDGAHSVFTSRLVYGLAGAADANGDKEVTQLELYAYIRKEMAKWCMASAKTQTPVLFGETARPLVLAHVVEDKPYTLPAPKAAKPSEAALAAQKAEDERRVRDNALVEEIRKAREDLETAQKADEERRKTEALPAAQRAENRLAAPVAPAAAAVAPAARQPEAGATPRAAAGKALNLGGGVTLELARIPAGKFLMGSLEAEANHCGDESPRHEVTLSRPFLMGKYEVTQAQYEQVLGKNPSRFKEPQNPVEWVSWENAQEFCQKVSAQTGQKVRLPTEAEWEYACRAGTATAYAGGDDLEALKKLGWCEYGLGAKPVGEQSLFDSFLGSQPTSHNGRPLKVGELQPNAWGLYDMHGNVYEWCEDRYARDYYAAAPATDPRGPAEGVKRVARGGSWCDAPLFCRSALRMDLEPNERNDHLGFRVVVEPGK